MGEVKIFELKNVGLGQAGKSILWTGRVFSISLIGSLAYGIFINLASSLNYNNKSQFNELVLVCERKLGMKIKPVPFSIYTHNLQGIKYVEYFNPRNPLT